MPRRQGRDEPVQFPVQRHLLQNVAPVRLECRPKVVDIDATDLRHHPVGDARRNAPHPEIVDAILAPPAHDVVSRGNLLQEHRNVAGIMLQIAIHGDDVLAPCMIEPRRQSRGLPEVAPQLDHRDPAVHRRDFPQHSERVIARAIVDQDNLEALAMGFHDDF